VDTPQQEEKDQPEHKGLEDCPALLDLEENQLLDPLGRWDQRDPKDLLEHPVFEWRGRLDLGVQPGRKVRLDLWESRLTYGGPP
jgi:hypothetical protein